MWYSIICTDKANSLDRRLETRPLHLQRLQALQDSGRLLVAGPNPSIDSPDPGPAGFTGSIIIAEFPDLDAAHACAAQDPYQDAGVYDQVVVKPFKMVFPA